MTLQDFPRGGRKPQNEWSSDTLFKQSIKRKNNEDRKEKKKKKKQEESEEDSLVANTADRLSNRTICEGLIILGRVHEVTDCELLISLPGSIIGVVHVTDISETYTNLIQNVVSEQRADEFRSLPDLYSVGDYVVCYVKNIDLDRKYQVKLSMEPRIINQNLDVNYMGEGSKVVCTVSSVEDHGYVVDLGVGNLRAFIQSKDAAGKSYFPGKQLFCSLMKMNSSESTAIVKLTTAQKYIESVTTEHLEALDNLIPGTKLILHVQKVLRNGLQVSFGKDRIGYVNLLYLEKSLDSYGTGMELVGTLLYVMPTVKFGYFSLLTDKPEKSKNKLKLGDVIDNAEVLYTLSNGVVLKLTKSIRGFVALKRTQTTREKVSKKFPVGTTHRCRIMSYNWIENLYMCTMQKEIIEQKHFAPSDFVPGEMMNIRILKVNNVSGFVTVQAGHIRGYIGPDQVSDEGWGGIKKLNIGETIPARVLALDQERGRVRFTTKKSLMETELPILSDIKDAKIGSEHHGTIVKINKYGLLVRFFGEAMGWVNQSLLNKEAAHVKWNYSIGQTLHVRIERIDEITKSMDLSIVEQEEAREDQQLTDMEPDFKIGEEVTGTITDSSTQGVHVLISNRRGKTSTGFLPAGHMSPCMEIAGLLASKCVPGETLSALIFAVSPMLILSRTFVPQEQFRKFENLKVGDCIPCSVRDAANDGLRVILPISDYTTFGFVKYNNVTNFRLLQGNPILFGKIISINKKERQVDLSMKLKEICEVESDPMMKIQASVDALTLYFNKFSELSQNSYYASRPISTISLGQMIIGTITKITDDGLILQLENNVQGIVRKDHYSDKAKLKVGANVKGTVMWINYVHEVADITLIPALRQTIHPKQERVPSLPVGTLVRADILMATGWFVLIALKGKGKGSLAALPVRHHVNDLQPDLSQYMVRKRIRCYIVQSKSDSDIIPICMVKSAFEKSKLMPKTKEQKNKQKKEKEQKEEKQESKQVKAKEEKKEKKSKDLKRKKEGDEETSPPNKKQKTANTVKVQEKEPVPETGTKKKEKKKKKKKKKKEEEQEKENDPSIDDKPKMTIPECGFFWDTKPNDALKKDESSSDSEEETDDLSKHKKKKLSAAERREQERQREREIRQREEALASNQLPNSVDQFDRLVLSSPDSSLIWLQYMAYHLQATEIEKARAVAKRALKTINFREENEKLNVWNAWLNLESKFGTPESLNGVFQEAIRTNDALKVYRHMLSVYVEAGRQTELEKTVNTMLAKFKQDPQVWIDCGAALLKLGLKDRSRHIMQRALQSLAPSQHVNLMVRFAYLENKFGDKERSQTLFEQVLSSYPKRVDVWCSYVDSLVKSGTVDLARKVLERAVVQTLPASKMKTLFKKFVSFEESHGTAEGVYKVQRLAAEYVEKQCNKVSL